MDRVEVTAADAAPVALARAAARRALGDQIDALGKRAKDLGGAAVLLALLLAGGTWTAVLVARFGSLARADLDLN
jgi:hypothetical protein